MTSFGLRHGPPELIAALARGESVDPSTYYFRTTPRFETGHPKYAFPESPPRRYRAAIGAPKPHLYDR